MGDKESGQESFGEGGENKAYRAGRKTGGVRKDIVVCECAGEG